ncbi:Peroxidase [Eumeta japonica]|uniref:Peroxidase n=1 Tax=Eumeta variegata TaxID=151549 RepID=A0A4C1WAY3_EUMVA|nr:Peroxidase [Eumeta japonica]
MHTRLGPIGPSHVRALNICHNGKHLLATSSSGKPLPNARLISRELFPPKEINDPEYTLLTMQFGQFITHDMSLTADVLQIENAREVTASIVSFHAMTGNPATPILFIIPLPLQQISFSYSRSSDIPVTSLRLRLSMGGDDCLLSSSSKARVSLESAIKAKLILISVNVQPVKCCTGGKLGPDATNTERCAPIEIPPHDPDFGPAHVECLDMKRTGTTRDRGCSGPDEVAKPLSAVTAWMDLSVVYGSSDKQAKAVREFEGGRLRTTTREGQEWPPQQENVTQSCSGAKSKNEPCYVCGDVRCNQNPQLTSLHIVMLREHNRIAKHLEKINSHWGDEKLFQEARRINIAQYQHFVYSEYLPKIIGKDYMIKEKMLFPDAERCVDDYDCSVDPAVYDEHANGGSFRNFHSAIVGFLQ